MSNPDLFSLDHALKQKYTSLLTLVLTAHRADIAVYNNMEEPFSHTRE